MKHHVKAPFAESTMGKGSRLISRPRLLLLSLSVVLAALVFGVTGASAIAPTVSIDPAPTVGYTTAHVSGTINPNAGAEATPYYVEYVNLGTGAESFVFGGEISAAEAAGNSPIAVSVDVPDLEPGAEYSAHITAVVEATEFSSPDETFTTKPTTAPLVTIDQVTTKTGTTAHFTGTVNPNAPAGPLSPDAEAAYATSWHFECEPKCSGTLSGNTAATDSGQPVSADAAGLEPGTTYSVRLVASNLGASAASEPSDPEFTTDASAPTIALTWATGASTTAATLRAQIVPGGTPTTYHFDYGTTTAYGQSTLEPSSIGSDVSEHEVATRIDGLQPGTTYHYRVVATNSVESLDGDDLSFTTPASDVCPNEAIREQQSATRLPDCQAYELVSSDHQGSATGAGRTSNVPNQSIWVFGDGNEVAYPSADAFVGESGLVPTFLSTRASFQWQTVGLFPHMPQGNLLRGVSTEAIAGNGAKFIILQTKAPLVEEDTNNETDVYLWNRAARQLTWISRSTQGGPSAFLGRSENGTDLFFTSINNLGPEASGTAPKLYRWHDDTVDLLSQLPDGTLPAGGATLGLHEEIGASFPSNLVQNAVSQDGSHVYFQAPPPSESTSADPSKLYLRVNGDETVEVGSSHCTRSDCLSEGDILYAGATPDGSVVYFTTARQLINDDTDETSDLYRYDLESAGLQRLSAGHGARQELSNPGSVIFASSEDGSRVYFRTTAGEMMLWDHGALKLLATFISGNSQGGRMDCHQIDGAGMPEATPDGRLLVFYTDNLESRGGLYLYRVEADSFTRIASDGSLPGGPLLHFAPDCPLIRGVTDDGSRIFFDSREPLVPQDVNGVRDVYEWRRGVVSLLSSGRGTREANLMGITHTGESVFFTDTAQLSTEDHDETQDVYMAREGGGFLESIASPCSGEDCKEPTPAPVPEMAFGSSTVSAASKPAARRHHQRHKRRHRRKASIDRTAHAGPKQPRREHPAGAGS